MRAVRREPFPGTVEEVETCRVKMRGNLELLAKQKLIAEMEAKRGYKNATGLAVIGSSPGGHGKCTAMHGLSSTPGMYLEH